MIEFETLGFGNGEKLKESEMWKKMKVQNFREN